MKLTSKYAHLLKGTEISLSHGTMLLFCSIKMDFSLIYLSWGVHSSSRGEEVTDSAAGWVVLSQKLQSLVVFRERTKSGMILEASSIDCCQQEVKA